MSRKQKLSLSCLAALFCGLSLPYSEPATASQVVGRWWDGNWKCNIDGRPARMRWSVVDDPDVQCQGDTCSRSSGVKWSGRFSDNGSAWVPLRNAREGAAGGLYFNHADGNRWYLARPTSGKANGWTTWNGKRYPLTCWK